MLMIVERLRALRERKNLSQGDIEKRTGLLRCYISRVEKWPHRSDHQDTAENGRSIGTAALSSLVRWR